MDRTSPRHRLAARLPGVLAVCAVALLSGCVVAPYYDAYGYPVAPAPAYAYPYPYPYDYYYGPAWYPAPVYGSFWFGFHGGDHHGWDGRGRGGWGGRGGHR